MKLVLEVDLDEYPTVAEIVGVMNECIQSFATVAPSKSRPALIMGGRHSKDAHRVVLEGLHERYKGIPAAEHSGKVSARLVLMRAAFDKRLFSKDPVEAAPETLSALRDFITKAVGPKS